MVYALSPDELEALFFEYKNVLLPLSHWHIAYAIRPASELAGDYGKATVVEEKTAAFIRLLDPAEARADDLEPYDMEVALVHELLHCALAPFLNCPRGSHRWISQEQAVHRHSVALVAMRRAKQFPKPRLSRKRARVFTAADYPEITNLPAAA